MEDYKRRMLIEFQDLENKCANLSSFIISNLKYEQSSNEIQLLLRNQLRYMEGYRQCLYDRIMLTVTKKEMEEFDNEFEKD